MSTFRFKQFSIKQPELGFKVGTDGVLIGTWAVANKYNRILDIGTGSGLIALIAAQRFNEAHIDAIELDAGVAETARHNFNDSSWGERLHLIEGRIQDYGSDDYYNLIISNPPYFENSMKSGETTKDLARHTDQLAFTEIIFAVNNLLKEGGSFCVVLPTEAHEKFIRLAKAQGLFCNKLCLVKPTPIKDPKRALMQFNKFKEELIEKELVIETNGRHQYSEEYKALTSEFYL